MSITSDKVRIPWRAAVSLALCLVALSPVAAENALVTGIGNQTCAYWQSSPDHQAEGVAWIYGFWSGLNYATNQDHMIGQNIDALGKIDAVKKACDAEPATLLVDLTFATYVEIAKADAEKR